MIELSLSFFGLRFLIEIDPETVVLILILARLVQRFTQ
jgi:hypothetical protein